MKKLVRFFNMNKKKYMRLDDNPETIKSEHGIASPEDVEATKEPSDIRNTICLQEEAIDHIALSKHGEVGSTAALEGRYRKKAIPILCTKKDMEELRYSALEKNMEAANFL